MHLVPFVSSALWWKENLERIRGRDSELWQSRFHDGQDCSLVHTTSSSKDLEFQQWLLQVVIQREGWGFPQTSGSGSSLEPLLRATLQMYLVKMHIPLSGWFGNHMPWNLDLNRLGTNQDVDKMLVIVIAQKQEMRREVVGFRFCSEVRFGVAHKTLGNGLGRWLHLSCTCILRFFHLL